MIISRKIATIAIALAAVVGIGCSSPDNCPFALAGIRRVLLGLGGVGVVPPADQRAPSLEFGSGECEAMGFAGCNNWFGDYEYDGRLIRFGPAATTRKACGGWADDVEQRFLAARTNTGAWRIDDGVPGLMPDPDGRTRARFVPAT